VITFHGLADPQNPYDRRWFSVLLPVQTHTGDRRDGEHHQPLPAGTEKSRLDATPDQ